MQAQCLASPQAAGPLPVRRVVYARSLTCPLTLSALCQLAPAPNLAETIPKIIFLDAPPVVAPGRGDVAK